MKDYYRLFLIFVILISLCSCKNDNSMYSVEKSNEVVINYPTDNTVNGYKQIDNNAVLPDKINGKDIYVSSNPSSNNSTDHKTTVQYCANIKSRVFHINSCSSVKNMNEENKYYSSNKDELLSNGYKPCSRCLP